MTSQANFTKSNYNMTKTCFLSLRATFDIPTLYQWGICKHITWRIHFLRIGSNTVDLP